MFFNIGFIIACLIYRSTYGLPDPQIIGGTEAPEGLYPYQVSLKRISTGAHFCGGAIVSKDFILTAAHCFDNFDEHNGYKDILIGVGSNSLDRPGAIYAASWFMKHHKYNKTLHVNDIALLHTRKYITFSSTIQPIELINYNHNLDNTFLVASGWGRLWNKGPIPNRLQHIVVMKVPQRQCRTYFGSITDGQLCAYQGWGKGMCNGDSGGPLVFHNKLVGLVSYGVPCGKGIPDVYTRVYTYKSWVDQYINAGSIQQSNVILGFIMTYLCIQSFL